MANVYLITGFPGTGKYTVATAMAEQLRAAGIEERSVGMVGTFAGLGLLVGTGCRFSS